MRLVQFILLIVLVAGPMTGQAKYPRNYKHVTFYYGGSGWLNQPFVRSYVLSYERYYSTCLSSGYSSSGIRWDDLGEGNYSLSAMYARAIQRRSGVLVTPYAGISPVLLKFRSAYGVEVKPELGIRFNSSGFFRKPVFSLSATCSYAYNIRVAGIPEYRPTGHELNLRLGLSLDLNAVKRKVKSKT